MKKKLSIVLFFLGLFFPVKTSAQSQELQQLILNIEKLTQFKQILKDMKKGYEILNGGYNTIKDLSQGNFSLHKTFLDGLMQVSPTVKKYKRVSEIIDYQLLLMKESEQALKNFKSHLVFSKEELNYIEKVYDNLFKQSLRNLDELTMVITSNTLRMSDDERLKSIDRIYYDMQDKILFLSDFNRNTKLLGLQRAKEAKDVTDLSNWYKVLP